VIREPAFELGFVPLVVCWQSSALFRRIEFPSMLLIRDGRALRSREGSSPVLPNHVLALADAVKAARRIEKRIVFPVLQRK
jgi:hypothetical protein